MKSQKHIRKEIISILLISSTGQKKKEFHMSRMAYQILCFVPPLICALFLVVAALVFFFQKRELSSLRAQLDPYKQQVTQLENEQENLIAENTKLAEENARLQLAATPEPETATEPEPPENPYADAPNGYPYMGTGGMLVEAFSEDRPYLSINTHTEGTIVAAGDGTVSSVGSDDTYPLIIEIQHENGYITRYMSNMAAQASVQEGTQVKADDTLFTITTDNTQFDYQILFENEPIDPLMVIEAKG